MSQVSFAFSLAHELHGRLLWFSRLRWIAVGGLAISSLLGPALEVPHLWPGLLLVAIFVASYNLYYGARMREPEEASRSLAYLQVRAIVQIALDLMALLVTVYFTGGLHSPVLYFFAFHMAIGTILIPNRTMYLVASAVCVALLALQMMVVTGLLQPYPPIQQISIPGGLGGMYMAAIAVAVYGVIYLTGGVTVRLKEGTLRLLETTVQLGDKTAELEQALADIQDVERRKSHYMRLSAHQLRSPLGTVKTSLDVLRRGIVDPSTERGARLLSGSVERVDGLLMIVNDLLGLAKIREGQASTPWQPDVRIDQLVATVLAALGPFAERREIEILTEIQEDVQLAWAAPEDLGFALENLIQNAIKYSDPPGRVWVNLGVASEKVVIEIIDEGIGIPEALQADIFLEFVRAPNAKHFAEGTGLGLAIANEAVSLHGGLLELKSEEGVGTTFTITIPLDNLPPHGVPLQGRTPIAP